MTKTLITGAIVLTMDDELGTLPRGDVLIDGSRHRGGRPGPARARPASTCVDGRDRIVHARLRRHPPAHVGRDAARLRLLRRPRHLLPRRRLHLRGELHPDDTYTLFTRERCGNWFPLFM